MENPSQPKSLRVFSNFCLLGGLGGLNVVVGIIIKQSHQEVRPEIFQVVLLFGLGLLIQAAGGFALRRRKVWAPYLILATQVLFFLSPALVLEKFLSPAWFIILPMEIWLFFFRPKTIHWLRYKT